MQRMRTHPEDEFLPLVYADWLDDQGDERGPILRLEMKRITHSIERYSSGQAHEYDLQIRALLEQASFFTKHWYDTIKSYRTRHGKVMNCRQNHLGDLPHTSSERFVSYCVQSWGTMTPISDSQARQCSNCEKLVHFCETQEQAEHHVKAGQKVAIPLRLTEVITEKYAKRKRVDRTGKAEKAWAKELLPPPPKAKKRKSK